MDLRDLGSEAHAALEQSLGYLNFSSGNADSRFLTSINQLYEAVEGSWDIRATLPDDAWRTVIRLMHAKLDELVQAESAAFADATQAKQVLRLIEFVLPQYREFHRDLLFHQQDGLLFRPFLLARFFEAILQTGGPWDDDNAVCQKVLQRINDYVGYRPVAVLETQRCEVYAHEKVRPIPLYVRGVGAAIGRYQPVIERAIQMIEATDPDILRAAGFYPDHLEELCIDPRAYDFDHPVNKRPNYHFGQWDIHTINDHGFYSRFVIQQVTLESLTQRIVRKSPISLSDRITEAAAVLAGTILMASGITGPAPDAYDSNMTLAKLLPVIAGYRDEFYARLINQLPAAHQRRLKDEANRLRQPFGAARQHLNAELTKRRASQLEHVRLASIFARMGHPEAAQRRIDSIAVVSARMMCQIDCHLTTARSLVDAK
ncbi:MAG: hypothetical protein KDA87_23185, partial [Planctomycetales bacterium]|nr:hypothetical protein [Planctomycetales bacterium]